MEDQNDKPIGVIDSGLGGLTVVRELKNMLPSESIAYFGDNANCPYGNRSSEEILKLSSAMLDFLGNKGIKIAAIACNTISVLGSELQKRYDFPIVSIIEAACGYAAELKIKQIGIFATNFTINMGLYEKLLCRLNPEIKTCSIPSPTLASIVDEGQLDSPAARYEVKRLISELLDKCPDARYVILGCTHYPIVMDLFKAEAPFITFINPAQAQAEAVKALLKKNSLLKQEPKDGKDTARLEIFTSGKERQYHVVLEKLNISGPLTVTSAPPFPL